MPHYNSGIRKYHEILQFLTMYIKSKTINKLSRKLPTFKAGFHMSAKIAMVAAIAEKKKRSAIVAIVSKPLFSDCHVVKCCDRYDR